MRDRDIAVAVGGVVSLGAVAYILSSMDTTTQRADGEQESDKEQKKEQNLPREPHHNIQRKAAIAAGGPVDHCGEVIMQINKKFDLNHTIFASVASGMTRMVLKAKLGNDLFWRDDAATRIQDAFMATIPTPITQNAALLDFMENECNFKCEHADGSFMDHLYFCADYGATHYKQQSPRVLFLHSILGVGTNLFPMPVEKLPQLESMLTEPEMVHIKAFPSFLRLMYEPTFFQQLKARMDDLPKLKSVSFHRVIDNESMSLDAEQLWIQLNFQLVHLIDFLPAANWLTQLDDPLFQAFINLHEILSASGNLQAHVDFDQPNPRERQVDGTPVTIGSMVSKVIPAPLKLNMANNMIQNYSKLINHELTFELTFDE